jgi:hypothetical protein
LWEPDDPWLYETEVSLLTREQTIDCVNAYFGQRKISVAKLPGEDYTYVADRIKLEINGRIRSAGSQNKLFSLFLEEFVLPLQAKLI